MCVCNLVEVPGFLFLMGGFISEMNSAMGGTEIN